SQRREDIARVVGPACLDYHLHLLEGAGLVETRDGSVEMTVNARRLVPYMSVEPFDERDLAEARLVEVSDISQLLPCPADPSMFRITARIFPPPGDGIRGLKAVFPRSRYSERMKALVIPRKNMRITLYSSGNVSAVMVRSPQEAEDALYELRDSINQAVESASRCGRRIDHMEINHLLAHTNCGECGEKSCYCFAIKLADGETTLGMCSPLKEARHSAKAERLKEILS
ncbi:MAG TPA: (Fe-S)-binding protein, partial [Methanotrichaceae archaeon]|nr:(Fe-S)-binding protein [Methanotrichaceae archaeon]